MNDSSTREIQLAWFSAASVTYLDLALTVEQRDLVFQECWQVAISHGDIKLIAIAKEFKQKATEMTKYMRLGDTHLMKEEYDDAIFYSKKCLDIAQECGDKVAEMNAYNTLGNAHLKKEECDDAMSYSKKCLDIAQECGDKVPEMAAYKMLWDAHLKKEEYDDAILYSRKCLDIAQECGDEVAEMNVYLMLGQAHLKKEEYDDAILYSKKCLDIAQECGDRVAEMNAYFTLGIAHLKKEEYDDAISYSKKCLGIAQEFGDKETEMNAYSTLGDAHLKKEEYDLSYTYLNEGMKIAKDTLNNEVVIGIKLLLGKLYDVIGLKERPWTEDELSRLIRVESCIYIEKLSELFMFYCGRFSLHISKQEYQGAYLCLRQALAIAAKHDDCSSPQLLTYKYWISEMYSSLCQYDKAIQYYQETLELAVEIKNNNFQAKCHFGLAKIYYDLQQFENAEKSFKESMKGFEVVFENLGQNDRFKIAFVDKYRETYKMLLKILIQANKKEEALLLSERYRARALKDLLISSYGMKKEETGKQSPQYTDKKALMSSSNYALVSYLACFGELYIFVIHKLEFSVHHFEYNDTCLDDIVDKAFDEMQVRRVVGGEENSEESSMTSSLGILYHKLIHNVMCSINQDEIVIIPEGPLNKVPFAALWDPDTGQYLSETKRIRLAPSITTLKLIQDCPVNHRSNTDALIIGDPLVGRVMMNGKEDEPFDPLPGARQEAIDIALILEVPPLLGNEATKPKVIEKLQKGASVVHIAANGSLEKGNIVLAPSEETRAKKMPEEEDYMLTMADVQQAQVRAQLVVLSFCNSGRGEIRAEGVVGMCRAFLASGARAVVASLWAIADEATLEFMKMFYKYLKEGKSASTSLHLTMKDMREKPEYSEPKYWAPFFLMGDDVTIQL